MNKITLDYGDARRAILALKEHFIVLCDHTADIKLALTLSKGISGTDCAFKAWLMVSGYDWNKSLGDGYNDFYKPPSALSHTCALDIALELQCRFAATHGTTPKWDRLGYDCMDDVITVLQEEIAAEDWDEFFQEKDVG